MLGGTIMKYYNKTSETGYTNGGMSSIISTIIVFLMIPCLLFGMTFLHLGIRNYRDTAYAKEMCDLRVDGTVTEYDRSVKTDDETEPNDVMCKNIVIQGDNYEKQK